MNPASTMMMSKQSGEVIQSLTWDQMLTPTQGENGVSVGTISISTLTGFRTTDFVWSEAANGYVENGSSGYGMTFRLPDQNNGGRIGISSDTGASTRLVCAEITVPSNGLWRIEMDNLRTTTSLSMFWSVLKDQIIYAASPLYSTNSPTPIPPQWRSMVIPCTAGDKVYLVGYRKSNRSTAIHYVDGLRLVKVAATPSIFRLSEHIPPLQQGGAAGPFYWGWWDPSGDHPEHHSANYSWRSDFSEAQTVPASYLLQHAFRQSMSSSYKSRAGRVTNPASAGYGRLYIEPGTNYHTGIAFFPPSPGTWRISVVNVCRYSTSPANTDSSSLRFYHTQLTGYGLIGNRLGYQGTSIFREAAQGRITVVSPEFVVAAGGRIYVTVRTGSGSTTGRMVQFDDIICEKIG